MYGCEYWIDRLIKAIWSVPAYIVYIESSLLCRVHSWLTVNHLVESSDGNQISDRNSQASSTRTFFVYKRVNNEIWCHSIRVEDNNTNSTFDIFLSWKCQRRMASICYPQACIKARLLPWHILQLPSDCSCSQLLFILLAFFFLWVKYTSVSVFIFRLFSSISTTQASVWPSSPIYVDAEKLCCCSLSPFIYYLIS
jgi:hypothetical protein